MTDPDPLDDFMPPPEGFSLDFLMSKLDCTDKDIADIVQYHRNIRAERASGKRTAKVSTAKPPEGLAKLLKPKPTVTINRRGL